MLEGYQRKLITSSLVLVGGSSKTIGFFFRSAEFFATDHRLVVAILKLHVKSRKMSRCDHNVFHLDKLKDSSCVQEYAVTVLNQFKVLAGNVVSEKLLYPRKHYRVSYFKSL